MNSEELHNRLTLRMADIDERLDNDYIDQAITEAIETYAVATESIQKEYTASTSTATLHNVTPSEDLINVFQVWTTISGSRIPIKPLTLEERQEMSDQLMGWYIDNDTVYVTDPTQAITSSVQVVYAYIPTYLNSDDANHGVTEIVNTKHSQAILAYAEYRLRTIYRDGPLADRAYNEYLNLAGIGINNINSSQLDGGK